MNQRGSVPIILMIIGIVLICTAGYFLYAANRVNISPSTPSAVTVTETPTPVENPTPVANNDVAVQVGTTSPNNSYAPIPPKPATSGQGVIKQNSPTLPTQTISTGYDMSGLPDCEGSTFLSAAPADPSGYARIEPMGNVSSYNGNAGHVLPTDHMYFYFNTTQGATVPVTVVAPADIKILKVNSKDYGPNGKDNQIYFASCKQVVLMYDHVATLSSSITSAMNAAPHKVCNSNYVIGATTYQQCSYAFDALSLKAGEQLGTAGGTGSTAMAFDFGAYDYRTSPAAFIDPGKVSNRYAVCPLNYYPPGAIKTSLFNKVENTRKNADGLPDCGSYMQDKAGTIQGNWYLPNTPTGGPLPDDHLLSVIHKNIDPGLGVIDWGGAIALADRLEFSIQTSGSINREPSQVTADGQIYCYQNPPYNSNSIILQLVDTATLKIEHRTEPCTTAETFNQPTTYTR